MGASASGFGEEGNALSTTPGRSSPPEVVAHAKPSRPAELRLVSSRWALAIYVSDRGANRLSLDVTSGMVFTISRWDHCVRLLGVRADLALRCGCLLPLALEPALLLDRTLAGVLPKCLPLLLAH